MSKVRVILKPGGYIAVSITAVLLSIVAVFILATQPERFQGLAAAEAAPPVYAPPVPPAAPAAAAPGVPSGAMPLRKWLVLRPLPAPTDVTASADEEQKKRRMAQMLEQTKMPGENRLTPALHDKAVYRGKTTVWEEATAELLNLNPASTSESSPTNAVGYAVTYVERDEETRDATLYVGSDDGVVVWLNGEEILRNPTPRPCIPGSDRIPHLRLKAGRNVLVFKVGQADFDWSLTASLESK